NQQQSPPLLHLPPEIREKIFAYALGGETIHNSRGTIPVFTRRNAQRNQRSSPLLRLPPEPNNCTALLLVCRQTYSETGLMPYHLNIFEYDNAIYFTGWLNALKIAQRKAIAKIHV
ncbi:hypothetical protein BCR34DRAFT_467892, partial [Clohesyomyces aquaticus]